MDELVWITNAERPEDYFKPWDGCMSREQYSEWFARFVVGQPQVANVEGAFPFDELVSMGLVGLYSPKRDDSTAIG